eukprot:TRINITY_DN40407_c0_g1_i1.p1 TRINITY_DN40407_c0_g1~~TRINITY_DN40407_c0_g1_i1.p1  ORF type:complete len:134 (+),score=46.39 TRINITY_DN40407_c0_g1_i1:62-463(+)
MAGRLCPLLAASALLVASTSAVTDEFSEGIAEVYSIFDDDQDGFLTHAELTEWVNSEQAQDELAALDEQAAERGEDENLSGKGNEMVQNAFAFLQSGDMNGDGKLSRDEFTALMVQYSDHEGLNDMLRDLGSS